MRFIYYDFPGHSLLVNYSNAYRPREEHKSLELPIMQTTTFYAKLISTCTCIYVYVAFFGYILVYNFHKKLVDVYKYY